MTTRTNLAGWRLTVTLGVSLFGAGCGEPSAQELGPPSLDTSSARMLVPEGPAFAGLTTVAAIPDGVSYREKVVEVSSGETSTEAGASQSGSGCAGVGAGENELTIFYDGRRVLRRRFVARANTQLAAVFGGSRAAPSLSIAEVDQSPTEPGQRRARITNQVPDAQPIQLFYYDADDQRVGESESIASGVTWTGTIPIAAVGYRLSPSQPLTQPFVRTPLALRKLVDAPCVEGRALGFVVYGRYAERTIHGERVTGTLDLLEIYTFVAPLCGGGPDALEL